MSAPEPNPWAWHPWEPLDLPAGYLVRTVDGAVYLVGETNRFNREDVIDVRKVLDLDRAKSE